MEEQVKHLIWLTGSGSPSKGVSSREEKMQTIQTKGELASSMCQASHCTDGLARHTRALHLKKEAETNKQEGEEV